jgi:hypothetical protein
MNPPTISDDIANSATHVFAELRRQSVAQFAAIKLAEGDGYERDFALDDWDDFVLVPAEGTDVYEAEGLMISGVSGRPYKVKKARENLRIMWSAWGKLVSE